MITTPSQGLLGCAKKHHSTRGILVTKEQIRQAGIAAGTDKVVHHAYERFYAGFLSGYDGTGSVVEIGYGSGESIAFWKALYPSAFLYVIDRDVELEGDGFRVMKCDQSSPQQLAQLSEFLADKDVALILDDGSHIPEHQLMTFNALFGVLREGGVYVLEDIECSYWRYGHCHGYATRYGLNSGRSLMNKLVLLSHWVNREFLAVRERSRLGGLLQRKGFSLVAIEGVGGITFAHNCVAIIKCLDGDKQYFSRDYRFADNVQPSLRAVANAFVPPYFLNPLKRVYESLRLQDSRD